MDSVVIYQGFSGYIPRIQWLLLSNIDLRDASASKNTACPLAGVSRWLTLLRRVDDLISAMPLIILGNKVRWANFGRLQIWSLFPTPIFNWTWLLADLTRWKCTINIVQTFSPQLQKESWPDRHSSSGHHPDEMFQKSNFWKDSRMHFYIFQQQ